LLPLRSKCVDLVVLGEVLEHCHSPWLVVKEARRVLVQGGMIAVTVPFLYKIHLDPGDYYRFTAEGLKHLFEDFEILKCQSFGNRVQVMFELACQGWLRYFLVWLSHPVAWLHWHDHTSPLGYMLLAKKI
jgi:ubiquinone/menaquinone biosynthesis C-methylase UbiE